MKNLQLSLCGESVILDGRRALYWPRQSWLLLADVHLGKSAVLRRAGIAMPEVDTAENLATLDALIADYQPCRLLVLGDLVHGAAGANSAWVGEVSAWRHRHRAIAMDLISGNHDRHFDARRLGFGLLGETLVCAPFQLSHAPLAHAESYVLAGHLHPGVWLRDGWRRHRLPAFRFGPSHGVLPAFGSLTGLLVEPLRPTERVIAVTPAGLLPLAGISSP